MPLEIPTIASEATAISNEVGSALGGSVPAVSAIRTLSTALAGAVISCYRYSARLWLDMFVQHAGTAEISVMGRRFVPLQALGNLFGAGDPRPATRARLRVTISHTNSLYQEIPAGAVLTNPVTGVTYTTDALVMMLMPTATAEITAVEDPNGTRGYGEIGNVTSGTILRFAANLVGVAPECEVTAVLVGGEEAESWESYRGRVFDRRRVPPRGGSFSDYKYWCQLVQGIDGVYPYTGITPGVVTLYLRATEASSGSSDGVPNATQLAAVEAILMGTDDGIQSLKPASDAVDVLPITRRTFNVRVNGLSIVTQDSVSGALEDALDEWFRSREPFIVGLSRLPRLDRITAVDVHSVVLQTLSARGGICNTVTLLDGAIETTIYMLEPGEHARLGSLTFGA